MSTVLAAQVSVGTGTPTKIVAAQGYGLQVLVVNRDATNSVFVGPANVTTTTGAEVKPGTMLANAYIDLPPDTELYAIAAAGTPRVDVSQIVAN